MWPIKLFLYFKECTKTTYFVVTTNTYIELALQVQVKELAESNKIKHFLCQMSDCFTILRIFSMSFFFQLCDIHIPITWYNTTPYIMQLYVISFGRAYNLYCCHSEEIHGASIKKFSEGHSKEDVVLINSLIFKFNCTPCICSTHFPEEQLSWSLIFICLIQS